MAMSILCNIPTAEISLQEHEHGANFLITIS